MSLPNYSFSLSNAKGKNRIVLSVLVENQHCINVEFTHKQYERLTNQLTGAYSQSGVHNIEFKAGISFLMSGQQITQLYKQIDESFDVLI